LLRSKRALKKLKNIDVLYLDDEIKSSRMVKVINYFIKIKNQKELYLIMGSDNLISFHKWTSWKKIVKLTKLVVFSRKGYVKKSKESLVVKYLNKKNIIFLNNKTINISSSNIKKNYFKSCK
jgi:nicotinate-nucleotide adenylyltransferase